MPFVIAVADFHKPASEDELGSMTYTQSAIWAYLYGFTTDWEMVGGKLVITNRDLKSHTFKGKTIESGFFSLPDAENVSAVVFSNAGHWPSLTVSACWQAMRLRSIAYIRAGIRYDPNPNAAMGTRFVEDVGAEGYSEGGQTSCRCSTTRERCALCRRNASAH